MKLGIVIYSNDPETVWNAFRFGNFSLKEEDEVKVFLIGEGCGMRIAGYRPIQGDGSDPDLRRPGGKDPCLRDLP